MVGTDTWIPFKGKLASEKDGIFELIPDEDEFISMFFSNTDAKEEDGSWYVRIGGICLNIDVKPGSNYHERPSGGGSCCIRPSE